MRRLAWPRLSCRCKATFCPAGALIALGIKLEVIPCPLHWVDKHLICLLQSLEFRTSLFLVANIPVRMPLESKRSVLFFQTVLIEDTSRIKTENCIMRSDRLGPNGGGRRRRSLG